MMALNHPPVWTDLYQLPMAQAYFNDHKMDCATFSLFSRSYPLDDVLNFLENFALDGGGPGLPLDTKSLYE